MSIEEKVESAAHQLDIYMPGWHQRVTRPIDLNSNTECVLGQVYGNFRNRSVNQVLRGGHYLLAPFFYFRSSKTERATAAWNAEVAYRTVNDWKVAA